MKYICISFLLFLFPIFFFGKENILEDSLSLKHIDTVQSPRFWNIADYTGEIITISSDTLSIDYFNQSSIEGKGISIANLGNWGSPTYSRIYFERKEISPFFFQDPYILYHKAPNSFNFVNTKLPYSNIFYQKAGPHQVGEEFLQTLLTFNVGKKINLGLNLDYSYARGYYKSQSAKYTDYIFFGNYLSERHQIHYFINSTNHIHAENGGIVDSNYTRYFVTHNTLARSIPTNLNNTWNRLIWNQLYCNYCYNFGFYKTISDRNSTKKFIPVSNIVYTIDYKNSNKRFYTTDSATVANFYFNKKDLLQQIGGVNDSTFYHSISSIIAFSMKRGFHRWIQSNLTTFLIQEIHFFNTMDTIPNNRIQKSATYIGEKLTQIGKILRYNIQGSIGILGYNWRDLNLSATIEARVPFWKDTVFLIIDTYAKILSPIYYENHYLSRYFHWSNNFNKKQKIYIGNVINIPHTKTNLQFQFENITNFIYFDKDGNPRQYTRDIQIIAVTLIQNFKFDAFHFDNQVIHQISTNQIIIPLPSFTIYSSIYLQFKIANTSTIQAGTKVHFWTKYDAPLYEPATQQFKLQNELKIGNYPLINSFLNYHLKQTCFFIECYNIGVKFISFPNYFSLPHYPFNPPIIKFGISTDFRN